jgi:hypothetical protein
MTNVGVPKNSHDDLLLSYVTNQVHHVAGIAILVVIPCNQFDESTVKGNASTCIKD